MIGDYYLLTHELEVLVTASCYGFFPLLLMLCFL